MYSAMWGSVLTVVCGCVISIFTGKTNFFIHQIRCFHGMKWKDAYLMERVVYTSQCTLIIEHSMYLYFIWRSHTSRWSRQMSSRSFIWSSVLLYTKVSESKVVLSGRTRGKLRIIRFSRWWANVFTKLRKREMERLEDVRSKTCIHVTERVKIALTLFTQASSVMANVELTHSSTGNTLLCD